MLTRTLVAASFCLILAACAEGTALRVGDQQHPPISPENVKVYLQPPAKPFEVVGIVHASSEMGWTTQQSQNYAITEMKKQAASLGANGVLLANIGSGPGSSYGSFTMINGIGSFIGGTSTNMSVSGQAILVNQ